MVYSSFFLIHGSFMASDFGGWLFNQRALPHQDEIDAAEGSRPPVAPNEMLVYMQQILLFTCMFSFMYTRLDIPKSVCVFSF